MPWTATVAASGKKLGDPGVATATIDFSDGTVTNELYFEYQDDQQLAQLIADSISQFEAADSLVASYTKGQVITVGPLKDALTPQQIKALGAVIDRGVDDATNVATVNATMVPNPTPQGTVPRGDDTQWAIGIFQSLSDAFHKTYWGYVGIAKLVHGLQLLVSRPTLSFIIESGLRSGNLLQADAAILAAARDSVVPDPMWPSSVTLAQALLGRPCTLVDIKQAR